MTEDNDTKPAQAPELYDAPEGAEGTGRYAVYDRVLGRYVGGVTDAKPTTTEANKLVHGGKYAAVVEV